MSRLATKVVVTLDELSLLKEEWTALLKESSSDSIFLMWEWVYTWCKHYLGKDRLCTVLFYDERCRLVGIAPMYIHSSRIFGSMNVRQMQFLGSEEVCPAYLDFIVFEKYRRDMLRAFYELLYGDLRFKWDVVRFSEMPAESLSVDYLSELTEHDGKVIEVADPVASPIIKLPKDIDGFLSMIGRSERYNLQRKRKRLGNVGSLSWERITAKSAFPKAMDSFIWLHQARWEGKGEAGAFKRPRFQAFHQEIGDSLAGQQMSCIDLLKLDGEPIAGIYGYRYNGRFYYYLPGFNHNSVPEASPGTLLLFRCVELAIAEGLAEFDLLRGVMPYKLAWANAVRRCITVTIFNRSLKAVLVSLHKSTCDFGKLLLR